ncbi:DUF47 domain-containing protein [Paenibacillus chartarius]|uniref:DUF47 domain-containing protein n=1 Tax=Paenibacillus chartarius TaxID=747481 RepID=A0ABV6DQ79_9BACL
MKLFQRQETDFMSLLIMAAENCLHAAHLFREAMMGEAGPVHHLDAMMQLEHKGDEITHEILKGLSLKMPAPLERSDIMELASRLDSVIDGIEATLARFDYLNIQMKNPYMQQYSIIIVNACQHILDSFKLLSNKKWLQISEHSVQLHVLEHEGDKLMREGIREIFTNPTDPYNDFKLKELYERMEQTTDACEDVADVLNSVVLRYS